MLPDFGAVYYPEAIPEQYWLKTHLLLLDQIVLIVPNDEGRPRAPHVQELAQQNLVVERIAREGDAVLSENFLTNLDAEFATLADRSQDNLLAIKAKNGSIEIADRFWMHQSKLEPVWDLLKKHRLIEEALSEDLWSFGLEKQYYSVDGTASTLILSGFADSFARQYGYDTITNNAVAQRLNAINGFGSLQTENNPDGRLVSAIVRALVPVVVDYLDIEEYCELRDSFSAVRPMFQKLIRELSVTHQLEKIEDVHLRENRIQRLAEEIRQEVEVYRKTAFGRAVRNYGPLCVSGLLTIASTLVLPPAAPYVAAATFGVSIVDKQISLKSATGPHDQCVRLLGELRDAAFNARPA